MRDAALRRRRAEAAGRLAETGTAMLLRARGFRIIGRRVRCPLGEIDLIARRGRLVVFAEVKLRGSIVGGLEAVTPRGRRRIVNAARWWLARNPNYDGYVLRFDVIVWARWSWPRHLANAFAES